MLADFSLLVYKFENFCGVSIHHLAALGQRGLGESWSKNTHRIWNIQLVFWRNIGKWSSETLLQRLCAHKEHQIGWKIRILAAEESSLRGEICSIISIIYPATLNHCWLSFALLSAFMTVPPCDDLRKEALFEKIVKIAKVQLTYSILGAKYQPWYHW